MVNRGCRPGHTFRPHRTRLRGSGAAHARQDIRGSANRANGVRNVVFAFRRDYLIAVSVAMATETAIRSGAAWLVLPNSPLSLRDHAGRQAAFFTLYGNFGHEQGGTARTRAGQHGHAGRHGSDTSERHGPDTSRAAQAARGKGGKGGQGRQRRQRRRGRAMTGKSGKD
jgi:hypothetical protein